MTLGSQKEVQTKYERTLELPGELPAGKGEVAYRSQAGSQVRQRATNQNVSGIGRAIQYVGRWNLRKNVSQLDFIRSGKICE